MPNSTQLIQHRVGKAHDSQEIVDVHALAAELHDHCSEMSIDEITRIIGEHVAAIKGAAMWRKPT